MKNQILDLNDKFDYLIYVLIKDKKLAKDQSEMSLMKEARKADEFSFNSGEK